MSVRQCNIYSKSIHVKLDQLIDEFFDKLNSTCFGYGLFFHSFDRVITEMEFRVFQSIFCETFNLRRSAFSFDQYVQIVFEKYVVSILKIRPINWIIFCCLLLLNMVRSDNKIFFFMSCETEDIACAQYRGLLLFTTIGCVLLVITLVFALTSRYYEIQIIKTSGIRSLLHYPTFLKLVEKVVDKPKVQENRLDENELKKKVLEAKNESIKRETTYEMLVVNPINKLFGTVKSRRNSLNPKISPELSQRSNSVDNIKIFNNSGSSDDNEKQYKKSPKIDDHKKDDILANSKDNKDNLSETSTTNLNPKIKNIQEMSLADLEIQSYCDDEDIDSDLLSPLPFIEKRDGFNIPSPKMSKSVDNFDISDDFNMPSIKTTVEEDNIDSNSTLNSSSRKSIVAPSRKNQTIYRSTSMISSVFGSIANLRSLINSPTKKEIPFHHKKKLNGATDVFLFSSPTLYFHCIQFLIMLISMYLSLWIVNYSFTGKGAWQKIYSLLPGLASAIVYIYIVKTSALLKAVYELDKDALLEVMEQTEGSRALGLELRRKLDERLKLSVEANSSKQTLFSLFMEIDDTGKTHDLTRHQFEFFMDSVGINFSIKKWKQIYREIDLNNDDKISFEEFFLFMCPDHDVAKALEIRRQKIIKNRATKKAIEFAERQTRAGRSTFTYKPSAHSFNSTSLNVSFSERSSSRLDGTVNLDSKIVARIKLIAKAVHERLTSPSRKSSDNVSDYEENVQTVNNQIDI